MASIYEDRLQLLSTGYAKNINVDNIPHDIIIYFVMWMKELPQIAFDKWLTELPLQIQLIGFAAKILNHQHIGKYQIEYKEKEQIENTKKDEAKIIRCTLSKIYNLDCIDIAFVGKGIFKVAIDELGLAVKVIAFDRGQKLICESPWNSLPITIKNDKKYDDDEKEKKNDEYFNLHIDINNKGFVDVDEWLIAMKQTQIITEQNAVNAPKKISYAVCQKNKHIVTDYHFKYYDNFIISSLSNFSKLLFSFMTATYNCVCIYIYIYLLTPKRICFLHVFFNFINKYFQCFNLLCYILIMIMIIITFDYCNQNIYLWIGIFTVYLYAFIFWYLFIKPVGPNLDLNMEWKRDYPILAIYHLQNMSINKEVLRKKSA